MFVGGGIDNLVVAHGEGHQCGDLGRRLAVGTIDGCRLHRSLQVVESLADTLQVLVAVDEPVYRPYPEQVPAQSAEHSRLGDLAVALRLRLIVVAAVAEDA